MHIYAVDYAKARNTMSAEEMAFHNTLRQKALGRFVINDQPETNEEDEYQQQQQQQLQLGYHQDQQGNDNYGYNGSPQQNAQQSDEMNDLDSLINEQEELSRDTKKPRTS